MKQFLKIYNRWGLFCCLFFFTLSQLIGQTDECDTEVNAQQYEFLKKQTLQYENFVNVHVIGGGGSTGGGNTSCGIPVRVYLISKDDGTGGLSKASLKQAMDKVNSDFANVGMRFTIIDTVRIKNSYYYSFTRSKENALTSQYYKSQVINLYFVGSYTSSDNLQKGGYGLLPGMGKDLVVIDNDYATNGSTVSHELGHYFSLLHTHQQFKGVEPERSNGTNCSFAGDFICDTPADPGLNRSNVNQYCQYTGANYQPDTRNFMSYAPAQCRNRFTPMQKYRMIGCLNIDRPYLKECSLSSCETAVAIQCNTAIRSSTSNAEDNFDRDDYKSCRTFNSAFNGKDKLFKFQLDFKKKVTLKLSELRTDLDIFLLRTCNPAQCINYGTNSSNTPEEIKMDLEAGTYYVVVDGYRVGEEGSFRLDLQCTNGCEDGIPITCGGGVIGNTINGSNRLTASHYSCYRSSGGSTFNAKDLVYKVEVPYTSILDVQLRGHIRDLDIFLLSSFCEGVRCIAYSTNSYNQTDWIRKVVAPGTYYIAVDGYRPEEVGSFILNVNCSNYLAGEEVAELTATGAEKPSLSESPKFPTNTPKDGVQRPSVHNEPNPFKNQTAIVFVLSQAMPLKLLIFDTQGRKVYETKGEFIKGTNRWDFIAPPSMIPGVYYYRLQGEGVLETKTMILSQ